MRRACLLLLLVGFVRSGRGAQPWSPTGTVCGALSRDHLPQAAELFQHGPRPFATPRLRSTVVTDCDTYAWGDTLRVTSETNELGRVRGNAASVGAKEGADDREVDAGPVGELNGYAPAFAHLAERIERAGEVLDADDLGLAG